MNKSVTAFFTSLIAAVFLVACAYNTRDEAPQPGNGTIINSCGDVKSYTYRDIKVILKTVKNGAGSTCTDCHASEEKDFTDSLKLKSYIENNKSKFIESIRFSGVNARPMPEDGPEMPDSLQKKIEAWICQGMKLNP
jgi:hypothetical protein